MANKVILLGRLGKDPELRYTSGGIAVATFSLATSYRKKDKDGNRDEVTEWHNIVVWRQLAEICAKFLVKGSQAYFEGRIQTRSYDNRDGNKCYITEIVADQMEIVGSKPENSTQSNERQGQQGHSRSDEPAQQTFNPDDDIPF